MTLLLLLGLILLLVRMDGRRRARRSGSVRVLVHILKGVSDVGFSILQARGCWVYFVSGVGELRIGGGRGEKGIR